MKISELTHGAKIEATFYALSSEVRTSSAGNPFISASLRDTEGDTIRAVFFDPPPSLIKEPLSGQTVDIRANADTFRNQLNLKLESMVLSKTQLDATALLPKASKSPEVLSEQLSEVLGLIDNVEISDVIAAVLHNEHVSSKLERWPAAKSRHHASVGGLLEHILELVQIAEVVAELYEEIDRDLLIAGCILHDIGKVVELDVDDDFRYTATGVMIGHIVIGDELVGEACKATDCSKDTELRLRHMVLSHHGTKEWGAPVVPQTAEAMALHHIDQISSQTRQAIDKVKEAENKKDTSSFGNYDRTWNRNWYVGLENSE
tara:strand:- start:655 stop:1608 length:954 start_codon:yes stop_codon:yes gene_type:complete